MFTVRRILIAILLLAVVGGYLSLRPSRSLIVPISQSAEEFFRDNRSTQPTALFMIGISGSGKSTWSNAAAAFDWLRIDSDQLLHEEIVRMQTAGEVAEEIGVVPDPTNSDHLFRLRHRGQTRAKRLLGQTLNERRSLIWDSLGLDEFKNQVSADFRKRGYQIWWLIFHADGIEKNRFNLFLRESKGGIGSFKEEPVEVRCKSLDRMLLTQLEKLRTIEATVERELPKEADRVFTVAVPDLRGQSGVTDPCVALGRQ